MQKQQLGNLQKQDNQPIYVQHFPFRGILPYKYKYQTFAKARWYGRPILQTLIKQFKAYDAEYYKQSIEQGRIKINNKKVQINYIIKNGDKLTHEALRQQPPILDIYVEIVQQNQDYLIVNKPPSWTVHTGGGFHYNTLISVLQNDKGYKNLYILHRLDRLTSGLIIFAKNKQKPQIFHKQNQSKQMKKMYYARVNGDFKWQEKQLSAYIQCISHKDGIYKVIKQCQRQEQQLIKNQEVQKQLQLKQTENHVKKERKDKNKQQKSNPDIKMSKTCFKKVFYDQKSNSSLIECYPISGRTHQIRVHLQYLGYPILNDVGYDGRFIGNPIIQIMKKQNNYPKRQFKHISQNLLKQQKQHSSGYKKVKIDSLNNNQEENLSSQLKINNQYSQLQKQAKQLQIKEYINRLSKQWDIKTKPWQIFLHSFKYKLQGKTYQTKKPYWAYQDYQFQ